MVKLPTPLCNQFQKWLLLDFWVLIEYSESPRRDLLVVETRT